MNHSIRVEAFVRRSLSKLIFNNLRETIRDDISSDRCNSVEISLKFRWMNAWITRGAVAINVFSFPPMCRRVSRTSRIRRLCPRCDRVYRFCEFCTSERSWNEYHYRIIYRKRSHIPSVRLVVIEKKRRKGINGKPSRRESQSRAAHLCLDE